uniref:Venom dipeptidyl peptidase 4 n=1 Tax=Culicoides sonorensis TaxID=179676 RepID=A0A336MK89_CULSO
MQIFKQIFIFYSYYVYERASQSYFVLTPSNDDKTTPVLQKVLWAPLPKTNINNNYNDRSKNASNTNNNSSDIIRQAIAFVYNNDVYYKPSIQGDVVNRLTKNGLKDAILNGVPDWLYAYEKDLHCDTLAFSTTGTYLAYLSFNITDVKSYRFTANYDDTAKYPSLKSIKYPKANTANPIVSLYVVDVSTDPIGYTKKLYIPFKYTTEYYVGGLSWVSELELSVTLTDRNQTKAVTYICKAPTFECIEVFVENPSDHFLVLPSEKPIILHKRFAKYGKTVIDVNDIRYKNNILEQTYLLKRLLVRVDSQEYYRHVVIVPIPYSQNANSKKQQHSITFGKYEVTQIIDCDVENDTVYYLATTETRPGYRHLYRVKIIFNVTAENNILVSATHPTCLSCYYNAHTPGQFAHDYEENDNGKSMENGGSDLETEGNESTDSQHNNKNNNNNSSRISSVRWYNEVDEATSCLYNDVRLSYRFTYFIQECLGPTIPTTFVVNTVTRARLFTIDDGQYLREKLEPIAVPNIKKFSVVIKNGFEAQVKLYLPPMLNEDEDLAYPLIVQIDASPGSQLVSEEFKVDWNWYLASSKIIIVAQVDARGSGYQGELLLSQIKGKLGTIEVEDQLAIITYLRDTFQFIDQDKIGVYGWGYGGYTALNALAEDDSKVLQCAIAIAPIISFKFYYSYFTERYIPLNDHFNHALRESDLSMKVSKLEDKNFLIIQGTADQIVHQQHSLWLAKSLINSGITFRQQTYADEGHDLTGVSYHLYKTMEAYFDENFDLSDDEDRQLKGLFGFKK